MAINKIFSILSQDLFRYVIAGIVSLAADYGLFVILYYVADIGTAVAAPAGLIFGLAINFTLNKIWSFSDHEVARTRLLRQIASYAALVVFNSVFTYYFIETLKKVFGIEPMVTKLFATAIITLWNYVLYKKVIFR